MALRAGQEVDSWCTRCKMDLLHRIVAMVGDKPARVECRTCSSQHNYRAPKSALASPRSASGSPRAPSAGTGRSRAPEAHAAMVPPSTAKVHSYAISTRFMADQWIVHRTFGNGLVLRELGPDKIEVRFDGGVKTLVHNRTEGA